MANDGFDKIHKISVGIPYKGLNLKDAISVLGAETAIYIENFMPPSDCLEVRKGYTGWADSHVEAKIDMFVCELPTVKCLMVPSLEGKLSQINLDGSVEEYDVGETNGDYSACVFGGNMYFCDGMGEVVAFDGASVSSKIFYVLDGDTHIEIIDLDNPVSFASRLFFTKGLIVYYGKPMENEGEVEELDLSFYAKKGGAIIKAFTMSTSYNDNIMSHICFLTSQGELITFIGTDPSDENKWSLGGIFDAPIPINKKCLADNVDGDILIFSRGGINSLKKIIGGQSSPVIDNLEKGLTSLFRDLDYDTPANTLFFLKYIKSKKLVVVGIPQDNESTMLSTQYVFSMNSGTWSMFTDLDICTLAELEKNVYGAKNLNSIVIKMFDGYADDNHVIEARYEAGYSDLGTYNEKFLRKIELFTTSTNFLNIDYSIDFNPRQFVLQTTMKSHKQSQSFSGAKNDVDMLNSTAYINANPGRKISFGVIIQNHDDSVAKIYDMYIEFFEGIN